MAKRGPFVQVNSTVLKEARLKAMLTQRDLADATDLTSTQISRLELGTQNSTLVTVKKLAEVLGIEVTELLSSEVFI